MSPKIVLFLCTGNYYRSRFAEIMFNYLARRDRLDLEARSRGLALELDVDNLGPISRHALAGLNTRGILLDKLVRYLLPLDGSILSRADQIVAMNSLGCHAPANDLRASSPARLGRGGSNASPFVGYSAILMRKEEGSWRVSYGSERWFSLKAAAHA